MKHTNSRLHTKNNFLNDRKTLLGNGKILLVTENRCQATKVGHQTLLGNKRYFLETRKYWLPTENGYKLLLGNQKIFIG